MSLLPSVVIDQPANTNQFTTTLVLTDRGHPDSSENWPAWAVVAMIHTLDGEDSEHDGDFFVTYASDASMLSGENDRRILCLIPITVKSLYYWDWGPIATPLSTKFVVNTDATFSQGASREEKGIVYAT